MEKIKILAIAPYEGMAETISSLAEKRSDIDLTIKIGNLMEGVQIAKELSHEDYDIIISRGGTADLIQQEVEIPVIDAPLSPYDMLRSIKLAEQYSGKFAVAGFKSITDCAQMLCDLLQMDIDIYTFESSDQVLPILLSLKKKNYSLVICDMIGSITAQNLGLNSILISSGTESITSALDDAVQIVKSSHHLYKQKVIFEKILVTEEDDFIIFDSRENIWFSSLPQNPQNIRILNMVKTFLPAFLKTDEQTFERQIDDTVFVIKNQHIFFDREQYTLLRLKQKPALFAKEDKIISIYNKTGMPSLDSTAFSNSANYVGSIHTMLEEYSRTAFPILLLGETGTGKDRAAQLLYQNGPYHTAPFFVIDCELINERKWTSLLDNENSPLNNIHVTIYLKHIDKLSKIQLGKLFSYFQNTNLAKRNRLIFSFISDTCGNTDFQNYFSNELNCLILKLPALRERTDDIPSISALYINELNASLGKQIVGFQEEAMRLIKNFSWPQNLNQFHRVLRELVIVTKTSYITPENVRQILKQESAACPSAVLSGNLSSIDINQTLDDINYDVIRLTLHQENMNKEKAAKRLGISRSTLWRILKTHETESPHPSAP